MENPLKLKRNRFPSPPLSRRPPPRNAAWAVRGTWRWGRCEGWDGSPPERDPGDTNHSVKNRATNIKKKKKRCTKHHVLTATPCKMPSGPDLQSQSDSETRPATRTHKNKDTSDGVILHRAWIKHTCPRDEREAGRDAQRDPNRSVRRHLNHTTHSPCTPA